MAATGTSIPAFDSSPHPIAIAPDPAPLFRDLSSRYDVVHEHIVIDSRSFTMLRVRDTNALLGELQPAAFAVDERLPYWAELWPSSIELARSCLEERRMEGKCVLEIGCGLGLAGIAAASAGGHVILTDYEPDALRFARYNALRNLPRNSVDSHVEFRLLDWRAGEIEERVDLILAADVVYERRNFVAILNFVRRSLRPDGCAAFTDPDRSTGMSFFALAEREGFDVALTSHLLLLAGRPCTILRGELRPRRQHA